MARKYRTRCGLAQCKPEAVASSPIFAGLLNELLEPPHAEDNPRDNNPYVYQTGLENRAAIHPQGLPGDER